MDASREPSPDPETPAEGATDPHPPMPSHARSLTRSTVGSILATGSEFVMLPILIHVLHVWPWLSYALVQFVATAITFAINRYWAFEAARGSVAGQTLRYALVFGGSLGLNTLLPSLGHYHLHLQPVLAFAISQVLVYGAWNYPMNRYFVFRRPPPSTDPQKKQLADLPIGELPG